MNHHGPERHLDRAALTCVLLLGFLVVAGAIGCTVFAFAAEHFKAIGAQL